MLGVNWGKVISPLIDWCSGRVYLPNAVHTALLEGKWLRAVNAIGTVKVTSDSVGLEGVKNKQLRDSIAVLKTPRFSKTFIRGQIFQRGMQHVQIRPVKTIYSKEYKFWTSPRQEDEELGYHPKS